MKSIIPIGITVITLAFVSFIFVITLLFLCLGYVITLLFSLSLFEATLLCILVGIMLMVALSALLARNDSIYLADDEDEDY
ncbi:MAG: hypothetical protein R3E08_02630 [Thiotrichaceae bacterium]